MKIIIVLFLSLGIISCKTKYIQEVNPNLKTKFGFEVSSGIKAVYFIENENIEICESCLISHNSISSLMYSTYGPAKDDFYIGSTNARDFKFNLANKSYYIDIHDLPKRTAMILFDGKKKPIIEFNPKKYEKLIRKMK